MLLFSIEALKKGHRVAALARIAGKAGHKRQLRAVEALRDLGDGEAVRALLRLCTHDDIAVWEPAQKALSMVDNENAVHTLCNALAEGEYAVKKPALRALASMDSDMAMEGLIKALEDDQLLPDVLVALRGKRDARIVEPLHGMLQELALREDAGSKMKLWRGT